MLNFTLFSQKYILQMLILPLFINNNFTSKTYIIKIFLAQICRLLKEQGNLCQYMHDRFFLLIHGTNGKPVQLLSVCLILMRSDKVFSIFSLC